MAWLLLTRSQAKDILDRSQGLLQPRPVLAGAYVGQCVLPTSALLTANTAVRPTLQILYQVEVEEADLGAPGEDPLLAPPFGPA